MSLVARGSSKFPRKAEVKCDKKAEEPELEEVLASHHYSALTTKQSPGTLSCASPTKPGQQILSLLNCPLVPAQHRLFVTFFSLLPALHTHQTDLRVEKLSVHWSHLRQQFLAKPRLLPLRLALFCISKKIVLQILLSLAELLFKSPSCLLTPLRHSSPKILPGTVTRAGDKATKS